MRRIFIFLIIIMLILLGVYFSLSQKALSCSASIKNHSENHLENSLFMVGEEEGEVIRELIITMARTNPAVLAFKKAKLEALGLKLRAKVTTFEFLAFVFSDPYLAKEMKLLQESSIKYKRFVEGFSPKMLKEYEKEGFYLRAHHFALHLEIDHEEFFQILTECLKVAKSGEKTAFRPVIDYLIAKKSG